MSQLVVDSSVVVKWYVPEVHSAAAVALLASGRRLLAPDLLVPELGNVLWKKVRRGELTAAEAEAIANTFTIHPPLILRPSALLLPSALDIANQYDRTVYDALYVALAVAERARLVTADDRLCQALAGTPLAPWVAPLTRP